MRRRKIAIWFLFYLLLACTVLTAFTWKPALVQILSMRGSSFYYTSFQATNSVYPVLASEDWAVWYFMGTTGLKKLEAYSTDQSLASAGRTQAAGLHTYISKGEHLPYLRQCSEDQAVPWITRSILLYVCEKDTERLGSGKAEQPAIIRK